MLAWLARERGPGSERHTAHQRRANATGLPRCGNCEPTRCCCRTCHPTIAPGIRPSDGSSAEAGRSSIRSDHVLLPQLPLAGQSIPPWFERRRWELLPVLPPQSAPIAAPDRRADMLRLLAPQIPPAEQAPLYSEALGAIEYPSKKSAP